MFHTQQKLANPGDHNDVTSGCIVDIESDSNVECVQANVMLEYTLDDAELLLTKNHNAALKSLEVVDNDLGFLRDQTTTIEVSILLGVISVSEAEEC